MNIMAEGTKGKPGEDEPKRDEPPEPSGKFKPGQHVTVSPHGLAAVVVRELAYGKDEHGEPEYEVEYHDDKGSPHDVLVGEGRLTLAAKDEHAGGGKATPPLVVAKPGEKPAEK